jgi:hypothetical protein
LSPLFLALFYKTGRPENRNFATRNILFPTSASLFV